MNGLVILLIGIAIGWLIELCIDYLFWRRRSVCAETVVGTVPVRRGPAYTPPRSGERESYIRSPSKDSDPYDAPPPQATTPDILVGTRDNLQVIWGIGSKIEAALRAYGIMTFEQLAQADIKELQKLLLEIRFPLAKYEDLLIEWQHQARHAATGQLEEVTRARQVLVQKLKRREQANLTRIWGIGEALEHDLYQLCITSFEALIEADIETLRPILLELTRAYGTDSVTEIYEAVILQARLALSGHWGRLEGFKEQFRADERRFDDFTEVKYISETIQEQLRSRYYINTWQQLAEIDQEALRTLRQEYKWNVMGDDEELLQAFQELARLQAEGKTQEFATKQAEFARRFEAAN